VAALGAEEEQATRGSKLTVSAEAFCEGGRADRGGVLLRAGC
jgi:hypothetical protein